LAKERLKEGIGQIEIHSSLERRGGGELLGAYLEEEKAHEGRGLRRSLSLGSSLHGESTMEAWTSSCVGAHSMEEGRT
jgi:hypothetical protein